MAKSKRNPKLRVIAGGAAPKAVVSAPPRKPSKTGPVSLPPSRSNARAIEREPDNDTEDPTEAHESENEHDSESRLASPDRGIPRMAIFAVLVVIVGIAAYFLTRSAQPCAPWPRSRPGPSPGAVRQSLITPGASAARRARHARGTW